MADILDQAVAALRRMPAADRESMAQAILPVTQGSPTLDIEPDHLPFVLEGLAQLDGGEFTEGDPEDLISAAFRRHLR